MHPPALLLFSLFSTLTTFAPLIHASPLASPEPSSCISSSNSTPNGSTSSPPSTNSAQSAATSNTPATNNAGNNVTDTASNGGTALSGITYQATITGYGPNCAGQGSGWGSCGFLGAPNAFQGAVSVYWNSAGLPGQCGTCWKLENGRNINGDDGVGAAIGTPPIVVMIDNVCAKDLSKPGFQCNQDAQAPKDKFGSVTVVDLCHDTGAPEAFWGKQFPAGQTGGLAVASISQVDCGEWQGSLDRFSSWTKYQLESGSQKQVDVKPGH